MQQGGASPTRQGWRSVIAAPIRHAAGWLRRCEQTRDIGYGDDERQRLDIYRPRGAAGAPVIVFFHGGSWQIGSKETYRFVGRALAACGYVAVVAGYRLHPQVKFPEFLADGAKALRWVNDNIAAFGGDRRRLFIMGHSAGAYNAAMLALDAVWLSEVGLDPIRHIAGFIGVSGPYDFLPLRNETLKIIFGGANRPVTQPITYAHGRKPPALLLTGTRDRVVNPGNASRLAERLRRNGNDATEEFYWYFGHITIMAAFAPLVGKLFPLRRDLNAFVARIKPTTEQTAAARSGAMAPQ